MNFDPQPGDPLRIGHQDFVIAPHPSAAGIAFGQEGRKSIVFQVRRRSDSRLFALKVFKQAYRDPNLVQITRLLAPFARLPGLEACERAVLTGQEYRDLLRKYADLEYAVLMPWIVGDTWFDIICNRRAISRKAADTLGQALLTVLSNLEERGAAHCDISGGNVIVNLACGSVSLVDVEDMYGLGCTIPAGRPAGTDGYQHRASRTSAMGQWSLVGDRFAGPVLVAEILTWHDAEIRARSSEEHFFSVQDIHDPASERYKLLLAALGRVVPGAAALFERAWLSPSLAECPSFAEWCAVMRQAARGSAWQRFMAWAGRLGAPKPDMLESEARKLTLAEQRAEPLAPSNALDQPVPPPCVVPAVRAPYTILATAQTPALIIFLLDTSMSMNRPVGGVRKIDVAWAALQNGTMSMIRRSTKGTVVAPRYRIAFYCYNSRVYDMLGGITSIETLTQHFPVPILDYGAQTALAFTYVERLLQTTLPLLRDCPAPLVCHLTDGMYAGADPEPVVARIQQLAVPDGKVLVENIFVSRSILKQEIEDPRMWRGVVDSQQILDDRKYARKLLAMSSVIPDSYLASLRDFGYQLQPGARMLMPGGTPELLRLAFVMSGATPTTHEYREDFSK